MRAKSKIQNTNSKSHSIQVLRLPFYLVFGICLLVLSACNRDYTVKPKAYPRVNYPERKYEVYDPADCPFRFEKPKYSIVVDDSTYFGVKNKEKCWLTVYIAPFNGTINLTYKDINDNQKLDKLLEDAHQMSYKHTRKADYINEVGIKNDHGVSGLLYDVGGDAASSVQFILTDSTKHFIRGALYFNNAPNSDSMAPVISFVKEDLKHMLETFEWK